MHLHKEATASGRTLAQDETQAIWAAGGQRWDAVEPARKRAFDVSADASINSKRVRLEEDKAKVKSELALTLRRSAQAHLQEGLQNRVSSCRMTEPQRQSLQHLFETLGDIHARWRKAMSGLDSPAAQLVEDMASVQIPPTAAQQIKPEEWCKRFCKHRELFSLTRFCE